MPLERPGRTTGEDGAPCDEQRAPILLVDDDERNLLALSQTLQDTVEVVTANSGAAALRHLLKRDFAVILLDVYMPDMDGYEVARIVREREQTARIPIVFLSAVNQDPEHLLRGYGMGAVDYVFKPVDPLILRSKVATFADLYCMRQQIEANSRAEQELKEATFRTELEKLEIERELHESRARQAALLDALPIALYEGRVVPGAQFRRNFMGGDLSRLVGDLAHDLETGALYWEERIHHEDQHALLQMDADEGDALSFAYRWNAQNGLSRHFIDQCVRLRDDNGGSRWVGTLIDVSERKQLEAKLLQTGKLEAIGQLTGGIAHDFNNLLAAVLGGIAVLERRMSFGPREAAVLSQMRHAAQNGAELVRRMMAFARRQDLRPELVEPGELCRSVSGLVQHTLGGTVAVEWGYEGASSNFFVDVAQLELALVNLIINARDAMPEGGTVKVEINDVKDDERAAAGLSVGEFLCVRVVDQGTGIPKELIDRVAEPFFTTKDVGKGTGLGLSMVMGFAQQSGGKLNIRSTMGTGTVMEMILPSRAGSRLVERPSPSVETPASGQRRMVLLADDDDAVREVLMELLSDLNCDVVPVADGASALKVLELRSHEIDILLTDFAMPGLTGVETIRSARDIKPELLALDAVPLLRKPIDASVLRETLQKWGVSAAISAGVQGTLERQ
jgi:signal transduction histidine kinase